MINEEFYKKHYKKFFVIPILLLVISLVVIYDFNSKTGDIVNKDVSLKGGLTATVYIDNVDVLELEEFLDGKFDDVLVRELSTVGKLNGFIIESGDVDDKKLKSVLEEKYGVFGSEDFSVEITGSSLGESFYKEMLKAILFAFLFMAFVVFVAFRSFIPSIAVIFAAILDLVITLAIVDLVGIRISTAGVAAFLLLLGYSIDTDVLLTTRMLKRKEGGLFERMIGGVKTGLTMTVTTIVALSVAFIFSNSLILKQMFLIILIGLFVDVISTYFMNAGILYWYSRRKDG
ncbi:hypothetical protein CL618_03325 [archaeon]|nr:hypothetical protein [archaeon]